MTIHLPPSLKHYDAVWPVPMPVVGPCAVIFDLIFAMKPELTVCVNTIEASLYVTAAQALSKSETDGIIFAATNWLNQEKFKQIQQHSRANYPSISYMMRESPHACLRHFSNSSITCVILQDQGLTDENLEDLIQLWREKLSEDGILVIQHQANRTLLLDKKNTLGEIFFKSEKLTLIRKNNITNATEKLIDFINSENGNNFYHHVENFLQHKHELQILERNKLINQIKKRITLNAEKT